MKLCVLMGHTAGRRLASMTLSHMCHSTNTPLGHTAGRRLASMTLSPMCHSTNTPLGHTAGRRLASMTLSHMCYSTNTHTPFCALQQLKQLHTATTPLLSAVAVYASCVRLGVLGNIHTTIGITRLAALGLGRLLQRVRTTLQITRLAALGPSISNYLAWVVCPMFCMVLNI